MAREITVEKYSLVAKSFHWVTASVVIFLFVLGLYMIDLGYYDENYTVSYAVHKAVGMIGLMLATCQVVWALTHSTPALLATLKPWESVSARLMHKVLFALILLVPASGYVIAAAAGQGVDIFGVITVPAVLPEMAGTMNDLEDFASDAHFYLAYAGACFVCLHGFAALKHHFIDKDRTLRRMF